MKMNLDQVKAKAAELGYSLERGTARYSGFLLIHIETGNKPLGADYQASLREVAEYLEKVANDVSDINTGDDVVDDVDIEISEKRKAPPSRTELNKAPVNNPSADAIMALVNDPSPVSTKALEPPSNRETQRSRLGLEHLTNSTLTAKQIWAFDRLSDADKEAHYARVEEAEDQRAKDAMLPKKALPLRTFGLDPDHPLRKEEARRSRVHHKANRQLFRTNQRSVFDGMGSKSPKERDALLRSYQEDRTNYLAPEPGNDYAPKEPSSAPIVVNVQRKFTRAKIAELTKTAKDRQRQTDQDKLLALLTAQVDATLAAGRRKPRIGKSLKEVAAMLKPTTDKRVVRKSDNY
jgi:hypothetical protein